MLDCCKTQAPLLASKENSSWWKHWVWCLRVDEVPEKGENSELVRYWQHAQQDSVWIKTTLIKLSCPPDRMLWNHLNARITAYTEIRQYWSVLPRNDITFHTFTILDIAGSDLHILLERKDNQLEMIIGNGKAALEFMKSFRAIVKPRRVDLCEEQPPVEMSSKLTVGTLLEWLDSLQMRWKPYDILRANCQHFSAELLQFLESPTLPLPFDFIYYSKRVLSAVRNKPRALVEAPMDLQTNRHFVLGVVRKNGKALKYAQNDFRHDFRVVLTAVTENADAFLDVPMILRCDQELVLIAVQANGLVLEHADKAWKHCREIVLAAVRQNGLALQFASPKLRHDREILLAAIWQHPAALRYLTGTTKELEVTRDDAEAGPAWQQYTNLPRSFSVKQSTNVQEMNRWYPAVPRSLSAI